MAVSPSPPASIGVARVRMFNRFGKALGELEGDLERVSWRLNKVGKASLTTAKTDSKATAMMLQFYNRALIEFDNGLPDWGGVMVPPRKWTREGIRLMLLDGAELLHYRMTDKGRYFDGTPAGTIFEKLIVEANTFATTGIQVASVWRGGPGRYKDYHYEDLLRAAQVMAAYTGNDFAIVPVFEKGTLRFDAYWYEERGSDRSGVALIEGHNAEVIGFEEQGPLINRWAGVGEGANWSDKPKTVDVDTDSWAVYGLRENARVFPGVVEMETLKQNVAELLEETKEPRPRVKLQALDIAPAQFSAYDVGDRVWVQLHSYGFDGETFGYNQGMRVLAREYDASTGRCELVVEESAFS